MSSDYILIEGLEFIGRHGVFEHERRDGCRFRVDLKLGFDLRPAGQSDHLHDTIDYSAVVSQVIAWGTERSHHLVERLADALVSQLLTEFAVDWVDLELRKLTPPVDGGVTAFGVHLRRAR